MIINTVDVLPNENIAWVLATYLLLREKVKVKLSINTEQKTANYGCF